MQGKITRETLRGILSMRVLEKDIINLTQKLNLQAEDFPSIPHSDFTLHPEHNEKRREEFSKANDDRIAMLERQLSHVQTELKSIKSP